MSPETLLWLIRTQQRVTVEVRRTKRSWITDNFGFLFLTYTHPRICNVFWIIFIHNSPKRGTRFGPRSWSFRVVFVWSSNPFVVIWTQGPEDLEVLRFFLTWFPCLSQSHLDPSVVERGPWSKIIGWWVTECWGTPRGEDYTRLELHDCCFTKYW